MNLRALQGNACAPERTLREWVHRPHNPLPAMRVDGGNIVVKRSKFDCWLEAQPVESTVDFDGIIEEVALAFRGPNRRGEKRTSAISAGGK
jgi:hypothetical protein